MTGEQKIIKRSLAIAKKMNELAKVKRPNDENYAEDMYLLGLLHDIGYRTNPERHEVCGGLQLMRQGYKYWEVISNHGKPDSTFQSEELQLLNIADMAIDENGEEMPYDYIVRTIDEKYGASSEQAINTHKIITQMEKSEEIDDSLYCSGKAAGKSALER